MKLSVSQVKCFCSSKAKRAGKYIMGIRDEEYGQDNLAIGKLVEHYLMTGEDNYQLIEGMVIDDMEKVIQYYDNAKENAKGLEFERGQSNVEVSGMIGDYAFVGYIDNLTSLVDDIKTSYYVTDPEATKKNEWSGMTTYEEYELQLWVYMRLSGIKKSRIIEIPKYKYKVPTNKIMDFELTSEFDKRMSDKYLPIFAEMKQMKDKYSNFIPLG